jgi:hypothetical protein
MAMASISPAVAGVPAPPPYSTVPTCFASCPLGDMPIVVTVRDIANNPVAGSLVQLDFSACPGYYVCSPPYDAYTYDAATHRISLVTDANGTANFLLRVGGVCGAGGVKIYASGVFLASYALASPDQDGDGFTSNLLNNDHTFFYAKLGGTDPTADFDCDGDVDVDDQGFYFSHASSSCFGYVDPVRKSSWGRLKAHYR